MKLLIANVRDSGQIADTDVFVRAPENVKVFLVEVPLVDGHGRQERLPLTDGAAPSPVIGTLPPNSDDVDDVLTFVCGPQANMTFDVKYYPVTHFVP